MTNGVSFHALFPMQEAASFEYYEHRANRTFQIEALSCCLEIYYGSRKSSQIVHRNKMRVSKATSAIVPTDAV